LLRYTIAFDRAGAALAGNGPTFALLLEFSLGFLYEWGHGVPQDYGIAAEWYKKAADHGDLFAQGKIGAFYLQGQGTAVRLSEDHILNYRYYSTS
jgi:uncharacterized protein